MKYMRLIFLLKMFPFIHLVITLGRALRAGSCCLTGAPNYFFDHQISNKFSLGRTRRE